MKRIPLIVILYGYAVVAIPAVKGTTSTIMEPSTELLSAVTPPQTSLEPTSQTSSIVTTKPQSSAIPESTVTSSSQPGSTKPQTIPQSSMSNSQSPTTQPLPTNTPLPQSVRPQSSKSPTSQHQTSHQTNTQPQSSIETNTQSESSHAQDTSPQTTLTSEIPESTPQTTSTNPQTVSDSNTEPSSSLIISEQTSPVNPIMTSKLVPTNPTLSPNVLDRYIKIPGMINMYNTLTYMAMGDVTTCAAECESPDEEDFRCVSFDICPSRKLCSLSPENVTMPELLTDSLGCDHYVRKAPNLKTYPLPDRSIIEKYHRMPGKFNPYSTLTYMAISDAIACATECDTPDERGFKCVSFDICAGQKLCSLSRENLTDVAQLIDSYDCDHYARYYAKQPVVMSTEQPIVMSTEKFTGQLEPSKNTGTIVGVAFGMLAVGLVIGIIGLYAVNKYRTLRGEGYEMDNLNRY